MEESVAQAQAAEEDYIANTFSKFGLNINLLIGDNANQTAETAQANPGSLDPSMGATKGSKKLNELLSAIPDFTSLTEPTVSMGQLFV